MAMISGISTMRDSVMPLGMLKTFIAPALRAASRAPHLVQVPVDALGERAADPFHLGDVVDRRCLDAAQAAEMLEQGLPALGADAGNLAQHGGGARLGAARAVADDRKAMRLVADRLDEMQR